MLISEIHEETANKTTSGIRSYQRCCRCRRVRDRNTFILDEAEASDHEDKYDDDDFEEEEGRRES